MSEWRKAVRAELVDYYRDTDQRELTLEELAEFSLSRLEDRFPQNDNPEAALRRTLQELRDQDEVEFLGDGRYRLGSELVDRATTATQTSPDPETALPDALGYVLANYSDAKDESDWNHPAVRLVESGIPNVLEDRITSEAASSQGIETDRIGRLRGSVGKSVLESIPWVGVFDERVNERQAGSLYVVYLFDVVENRLLLTLNQGWTDLKEVFGMEKQKGTFDPELARPVSKRADILREQVSVDGFQRRSVDLPVELLTRSDRYYSYSTICHQSYDLDALPDEEKLVDDLRRLVAEYQRLVEDGVYEELLDAFDEEDGVQHDPFDDASDLPDDLLDHVGGIADGRTLCRFTMAADDWLPAMRYAALPFGDRHQNQWRSVEAGDVVLLHAAGTSRDLPSDPEGGVFGIGVVADREPKDHAWWWDEFVHDVDYPSIARLDPMYVAADVDDVDLTVDAYERSAEEVSDDLQRLLANARSDDDVAEIYREIRDEEPPTGRPLVDLTTSDHEAAHEFALALADEFGDTLTDVADEDATAVENPLPAAEKPRRAEELRDQLRSVGQVVLHGPPGTGKTYTARRFTRWWLNETETSPAADQIREVTFHPSFSYEDFMEGLTASESGDGGVAYEISDGIFKEICADARRAFRAAEANGEPAPKYVLVVDEINRGNLPKIFGETISQLEADKRLGNPDASWTRLSHSGDPFVVPPNLYIVGTMNTADRSIALLDAALRRRFSFHSFPPEYEVLYEEHGFGDRQSTEAVARRNDPSFETLLAQSICALRRINENVVDAGDLGKGKRVGHSYLLGVDDEAALVRAWRFQILPLLEEYYFEEIDRLQEDLFGVEVPELFDQRRKEVAAFDADQLRTALRQFLRRSGALETDRATTAD